MRAAETRALRYRDAHGFMQELRVTSEDAAAIEAVFRSARRADQKWRERHVAFTDLGSTARMLTLAPLPQYDLGNAWEGPRFSFAVLLGAGRIWTGDPTRACRGATRCRICKGMKLSYAVYCIGCDRSGRDFELPSVPKPVKPKAARPFTMTMTKGVVGLKGGLEGKR